MLNLHDTFMTDTTSEEDGKWFYDILGDDSGLDLKLRRLTSKAVDKARTKLWAANRKHMVKGKMPADHDEKLLAELLATAVMIDWHGVANPDSPDEALPYSPEHAHAFLVKLPNLRRIVVSISGDMAQFKADATKEIEGN